MTGPICFARNDLRIELRRLVVAPEVPKSGNDNVNRIRERVRHWREGDYQGVTHVTRKLLQHWSDPDRENKLSFCQIEALETLVYLTEAARKVGDNWIENWLREANDGSNPGLSRIAMKMATGSGKTVVMAMLIAWHALNKIADRKDRRFSDTFLVVTPGITIKDRLRVLLPNDPENYYRLRDLVPPDLIGQLGRAKILITNFHAFKIRKLIETNKLTKEILQTDFDESPAQMVNRVCREFGSKRNIVVINDEAHHCYRSLYGNYESRYRLWEQGKADGASNQTPPVFIVVCNNTNVSKLVFDYVGGWERTLPDGSTVRVPGQLALFSNVEDGRWKARPLTILIDSEQLESGDAMSPEFKQIAALEIDEFKSEYRARFPGRDAEGLTDEDLLREVMNTVGKPGKLGEQLRCVVSVSMLTEGWDASTVTHVLGIRAFGTQLLCEQVVGRALRRMSYAPNDEAKFTIDAKLTLTNADIPTKTDVEGIVGAIRVNTLDDLKQRRTNEVAFRLAKLTLERYFRDDEGSDKPWLFPQLLAITKRWLDECLTCKGGTFPQLLMFVRFAHEGADRIYRAIVSSSEGTPTLKPILRPYDTIGTTRYVDFHTIRETYKTRADKCHVSHVAGDSGWEFKLAHALEDMPEVVTYVKNQSLGFSIRYSINNVEHQYYPDFLVRIDDGHGKEDALNLILEVTGERKKEKEAKTATARTLWMPAVNNHGGFGRRAFLEVTDPYDDVGDLIRAVAGPQAASMGA